MEREGVVEEENPQVKLGGEGGERLVGGEEEVGEGAGEGFGVVELGVEGGERGEEFELGEELVSGGNGGEGVGVGVREDDGVVCVTVAVLYGSPFGRHDSVQRE